MRFWGIVAVLFCLGVTAPAVEAYYLDTPHNESNGIYCYTCHSLSVWWNFTPGGPDDTVRNAVCLQCHDEASVDPKKGPAKMPHSSSSTSTTYGTWTTECTQCHDVHSQGQLDWAGTDDASLFLAQGVFNTGVAVRNFNLTDPAGGGYGATTVGIGSVTGAAGWTDTATWGAKGGKMDPARALDNSRGLVLVPNKANPSETFEILSVAGNIIKVKGNMTQAPNGQSFGVIYGQSLKSYLLPNGGATVDDYRDVKFFKPEIVAGTYGGYIDQTPAATEPTGLCQVCHDITSYWNNNGANSTHNAGTACGSCHDVLAGGQGGADHGLKIANHFDNTTYAPAVIDCSLCHDATDAPGLHAAAVNAAAGTGCEACHNAGQSALNADVASRLGVTAQFGDDGAWPVTCAGCHPTKPAAVAGGTHGGHGDSAFGWDANCADCHSGVNIARDVHGNVCTVCHDPAAVASGNYTVRRVGDATNGIDGDATSGTLSSTCTGCHNTNTPGVVHHDSAGGQAVAGDCTFCHAAAGHEGNHTALVADYLNCTSCHAGNVGSATGAPVGPADPKMHDACVSCHNTDGTLKALLQVGGTKVVAMPDGGAGTSNGGGTCAACHGEYFASHANVTHTARVAGAAGCDGCHTATAGTATTVPLSGADNKVHDACATCHNANGSLKAAYGKASAMPVGGGACTACHGAYFVSHVNANHTTRVAGTTNCTTCHTATAGTATTVPVSAADGKVHDACGTCHDATTNLLRTAYGKASAMPAGGGDCNGCHGAYFASHVNANHATRVAGTTNCTGCHTATAGTATTVPVSAADGKVHDYCATCHNATTGALLAAYGKASAMPVGGGNCNACHGAYFVSHINADHTTRVSLGATTCGTCHTGTAGTATTVPVSAADNKVHDACTSCHNATTGALLAVVATGGSVNIAAGDCGTCHSATYFNSHTHHTVANKVSMQATDLAQGNSQPCSNCHVPAPAGLTTWASVYAEHLSSCDKCHTSGRAEVITAISTKANPTGCLNCHSAKAAPATHGGHSASDFAWDATTQASCGTVGCHDYVANGDVVMDIHGGTCTICHNNANGGDGTTILGSATNGSDGDARLGSTASPHTDNCLVCHNVAAPGVNAATIGGIHHDNKTDGVVIEGSCTTKCHTVAGFKGNHSVNIATTTNCSSCHTATAGDGTGAAPINAADNKVHDACTSCHSIAATPAANGVLRAVVAPGGSGNIAAGNCNGCHGAYFPNHTSTNHTTFVSSTATCTSTCHTATAGTVSGVPVDGTAHTKVHDACTTCHNGTTGALLAAYGHAWAMPIGGGQCTTCHSAGNFVALHDWATVDHSTKVTDSASCNTCHTATKGTATGIPVDATAHTKVHDTCATCHSDTTLAVLKPAYGHAGANATGSCTTCHNAGNFVALHDWATVDHSAKVADSVSCNTCHTATKGTATGIPVDTTAHTKVHDSCATCHSDTTLSVLKAAYGHAGAMTATGTCTSCHTATNFLALHDYATVDHSAKVTDSANCNTCHTATKGTATGIPVDATAHTKVHDACNTCHSDTTLAPMKTAYGHASANVAGSCITCHTATFTGLHDYTNDHTTFVADSASCNTCHTATKGTISGVPVDATAHTKVHDACSTCHNDTTGVLLAPYGHAGAMPVGGGACTACHNSGTFTSLHDWATVDHSTKVTDSASCNTCHTATKGTATGIPTDETAHTKVHDSCATCHSDTTLSVMKAAYGHAGANATGSCTTCHNAGNFVALHDWATVDHSTKVGDSASCNTCHTATKGTATGIPVDVTAHTKVHDSCATCHSDTTLSVLKAAYGHAGAMTATGTCTSCHNATNFLALHDYATVDHSAKVTDSASCNTCHTATKGTATGIPVDATAHTKVHDSCATCHSDTTLSPMKAAYGHAGANATGSCTTCHNAGNFASLHDWATVAHDTKVTGTAACITCHTGTAGTATTIPVSAADNKVHDLCTTCHSDTTLAVLKSAPIGTAATMATGQCITCHSSFAFANHSHVHDVTYTPAVDTSQPAVQGCSVCHLPAGTAWTGIKDEHLNSCDTCHTSTRTTGIYTPYTSVPNVIATATGVTCRTCHADKTPNISHGGHPTDFGKSATCTTSCHTGASVLVNIHGNGTAATCTICHSGTPSRDNEILGSATNGVDGDARLANGTAAASSWATKNCLTCHPTATYPTPAIHHDGVKAKNGECVTCHLPDVGETTPRASLAMPANLACNFCHLWWPKNKGYYTAATDSGYDASGTGGTVKIFGLNWDPNVTTAKAYTTSTAITTHSISTNTTTPISDYAACFACHGASAATKANGKQVKPFHGFGPAVTGFTPLSGNSGNANHLIEWYAGAPSTGQNQPKSNNPFHPGFGAFNHLAVEVAINTAKAFTTDDRKAHDLDLNQWLPTTAITAIKSGEFSIPWDSYNAAAGTAPGTSMTLNTGGMKGSFTKSTIVPLVPLNLPTTITP